jgi:hypothetical protein
VTTLRRYVRQIVAPNGRHRARPLLLPDEPIPAPAVPARGTPMSEDELLRLLDEDAVQPIECAPCPCCNRITAHAMNRDSSRRCWTCGTTTTGNCS